MQNVLLCDPALGVCPDPLHNNINLQGRGSVCEPLFVHLVGVM